MADYKYPDNTPVYLSGGNPQVLLYPEHANAIKGVNKRMDIPTLLALDSLMWIEPAALVSMLKARGDQLVKFVDCRAADMSKEDTNYRMKNSICFDIVGTGPGDLTPSVFQERVKNPTQYKAEKLFPKDSKDAKNYPEAVVFYCQQGMNRSPVMGFRYAQYCLRQTGGLMDMTKWNESLPLPRVYVLKNGIGGLPNNAEARTLLVDKDGKEYPKDTHSGDYNKQPNFGNKPGTRPTPDQTRHVRPQPSDPPPRPV